MPLATIEVRFFDPPVPFDAASDLLSLVAYPKDKDRQKRNSFALALCRREHIARWRQGRECSPEWIRPIVFFQREPNFKRSMRDGLKKLRLALITASEILTPHLNAVETGRRPRTIDRFSRTVTYICQTIMEREGWRGEDLSTFESKVWGPIRPIAHLAFSLSQLVNVSEQGDEYLSSFRDDDILIKMLERAEAIRLILPKLPGFQWVEDDTIRILAKRTEAGVLISRAEGQAVS